MLKELILTILVYHQIGPAPADDVVPIESFAAQMQYLHENGYKVITTKEAVEGKKGVVIHFDDGWRSSLQAVPILKRYGFPATFFIVAGETDGQSMGWQEIVGLAADYEVYSHSLHHSKFLSGGVEEELIESKRILEERLGRPVPYFAWPYGAHSDDLVKAARDAGYTAAFGVKGGVDVEDNEFRRPRMGVSGFCTLDDFADYLEGKHHWCHD